MPEAFWIVVLVLAGLGALAVGYALWGRRRFERDDLRRHFGPEYDRAVEETGSGKAARKELRRRVKRAGRLDLRALSPEERARFARAWRDIQARFLDDPMRATRESGELVDDAMRACGYELGEPERTIADLSVHAPEAAAHARAAKALARPGASTEDLRRATVHFRAWLDALLGPQALESTGRELPSQPA